MSASYLSKSVTPSTATSWTVSFWFKLTNINPSSGTPYLWSCGSTSGGGHGIYYNNGTDVLRYYGHSGYTDAALSSGVLRDTNAWYHLVLSVNAGTGTSYINGVQQGSTISSMAPLNAHTGNLMAVNAYVGGLSTYDDSGVYMSHFHFIDGTAYPASTFGSTDSTTGEWKIKTDPTVTYGTNGFFLFKDNASVNDQSGNSNNFTSSGTITQTEDNPSNSFATLNPLNNYYPEATFSNGNNKITTKESAPVMATIGASSGKYYWEVKVNALASNYGTIGIVGTQATASTQFITSNANEYMYYSPGSLNYNGGSVSSGYASYTAGDIIGVAMDLDNNRLFFSKNGTFQNSADPTSSTGAYTITAPASTSLGLYSPAIGYWDDNDAANGTYEVNFGNGFFGTTAISSEGTNASGNGKFEYDVPTGYTALSTKGLNL